MIARFAAAALAATFALGAAAAQPAPDAAALDLARLIMARDPSLYDDADPVRMQQRVERIILETSNACDPFNAECQAAAIPIARQYGGAYRQAEHERAERVTALMLAEFAAAGRHGPRRRLPAQRGREPFPRRLGAAARSRP